ncbi:MAG: hypothetical protein LC645_01325 [Geobacteraceae bacterium]|nr:hypothetical protein [Geobacteraceae bacterium]
MDSHWEAICRRCGRCCYHKIIYRQALYYTDIPCAYLDQNSGECQIYSQRQKINPECAMLTPALVQSGVLPAGCAYLQYCGSSRGAEQHISELPTRLQRRLLRHLK